MKQEIIIPALFGLSLTLSSTIFTNAMERGELEEKENVNPSKFTLPGSQRKQDVAFQDNSFTQTQEESNQKRISKVESPLVKLIANLEGSIQEAQQMMNAECLINMDQIFKTIQMEEEEWESLCHKKGFYKWPLQQTWKESYGGYLFYPKREIEKYNDFQPTRYLLNREDIVKGLEISISYNYPVAQFMYLDRPYLDPLSERKYKRILNEAIQGLQGAEGVEAFQLKIHYLSNYDNGRLEDRIEEILELLSHRPTVENRLRALNIRFEKEGLLKKSQPSTKEEFLSFGESEKCGSAFRLAVDHFASSFSWEEKTSLLAKAFELGDIHALCILADLYSKNGDKENALEYYTQYAKNGYSHGYKRAIFLFYNPITQPSTGEMVDILKAKELAEQAVMMHDEIAATYLSTIKHKFNIK